METKKEIRQKIRQKRRELEESIWMQSCKEISDAVISHPWFLETEDIYTYVDYNREVETRRIIDTAFKMGKSVWVPKVTGNVMHFYCIKSMAELSPGAYGILEPVVNVRTDKDISKKDADGYRSEVCGLMIMPGVAFDAQCRRIGYGGGYYDRYLEKHPKLHTMALAFEFQIFPEVPHEEYDICPEILITERRIICRQDYPKIPCFC